MNESNKERKVGKRCEGLAKVERRLGWVCWAKAEQSCKLLFLLWVGRLMLVLPMTANGEPGVVSIFAAICLTIEHLSFHGEQRAKQQNKTEQPQEKEEERAN